MLNVKESLFFSRFRIHFHRLLILRSVVIAVVPLLLLAGFPSTASAFWLLGFSDANTLPPQALGMIAGTGGQYANVGNPSKSSSTIFLPHAGFRLGLADNFDIGYRLTQVALPFSSVGPSLGTEVDVKYRFTRPEAAWQAAFVAGAAFSSLELSGQTKNAWSPGVDLIVSKALTEKYTFISELRYVYTAIPTAPGGVSQNNVGALGTDIGLKIKLTDRVSLIPEFGIFDLRGSLIGNRANGIAVQAGAVLSARVW